MAVITNTENVLPARKSVTPTPPTTTLGKDGATGSKADAAAVSLGNDLNTFLKLLTTQLNNQDPTEPLDTNQMTQQLVSLSGVEQSIATNKNLEKMLALLQTSQLDTAVSYIGKSVEAEGNKGMLQGGQAEFAYDLPAGATAATITITNSEGRAVFSGEGSKKTGKNVVIWDGVNSFTSKDEPDGQYTISIAAKDAKGDLIKDTKTYTSGRVTSVDMKDGNVELNIGTLKIAIDKVISIREAAPIIPQSTASQNTTNNNG
jgi:flagellar basal-body rod modification protein FlgD